ncbi:HAMP domain-containing protein, partial [bacterium]|nr:HAMP domain-containing protein [bacterium]
LGIVGLILAVLVSYMLGRRLSKRLETLHAGARAFTAGQLGHRLPVRHRDPIGRLQEAFNQMAETLQSKEADIQRHIDRLNESVNDAQAANRAKTEFLANMSHEIRTPINGVLGMTELLLHNGLDEESERFARAIESSGRTLLAVCNDILDLSRIEAGQLDLDLIPIDLRELVEDMGEM